MNAPTPWLSVVTVVKDDPEGFDRTATSLSGQVDETVEWIVVDGSTHGSAVSSRVSSLPEKPHYVWQSPAGVYSAMNAGLGLATGEYVYFLNAGDRLHGAGSLARMRQGVATRPLWLYGQVQFVTAGDDSITPEPFDYERERRRLFARGRFPSHQGTIVRTETLRSIGGFDESYLIAADYAAVLRLTLLATPIELADTVADFYVGGVSSTSWKASLQEFHRARREILHPAGTAAVLESWDTAAHFGRMSLHRWLRRPARQAPGGSA